MSRMYDNWERLVEATLKREQFREICLANSTNTSFSSSMSDDFSSLDLNFTSLPRNHLSGVDGELVEIYRKTIELADEVAKRADEATSFKQECTEIKSMTEELALLLRSARVSNNLYDRPIRRMLADTYWVLAKVLALVLKCSGVKRVFIFNLRAATFRKMRYLLGSSIGNISWLHRSSSTSSSTHEHLGLPPIAAIDPIIGFIWAEISILYTGSIDDKSEAAASLVSLALDNDRNGRIIAEEGGVEPLLKLVNEGELKGQENAARAIGLLGKYPEYVEHMMSAGVCSVFSSILYEEEGPIEVQVTVAWAVSELAKHYPKCQDLFAQHDIIRFLVTHLASETAEANMKAMAARALWYLAKGNSAICQSIIELRALFRLAVLLEKGTDQEVKYNCAMALMEITAVAEVDADLRRSTAFKPNSPSCIAVVNQLLRIIDNEDSELRVPCIKAMGNLALTFRTTEIRIISSLVKLLDDDDEREVEVIWEACIALTKFACSDNYQHLDHSKAIIGVGGVTQLVYLVYFREFVQSCALVLLCYIALHVPDSKELAQANVISVLVWASEQPSLIKDEEVAKLLSESKAKLELYQSRGF